MATFEFRYGNVVVECECTYDVNALFVRALSDLLTTLDAFQMAVPLSSLVFKETLTPDRYKYKFIGNDGRVWEQTVEFAGDNDSNPRMNFQTDFWQMTEFALQRPIREQLVAMRNTYRVTKLEITW